jgi:hypothetical protein
MKDLQYYWPGQCIPCDDPQKMELIRHEPEVLDILRVANGVLPEQYLLPMYEVKLRESVNEFRDAVDRSFNKIFARSKYAERV